MGYISLEQHEQIQHDVRQTITVESRWEPPRRDRHYWLEFCSAAAAVEKLMVCYTGNRPDVLRYVCYRAWLDNGAPPCIGLDGFPVDEAIARAIVRLVQPPAIEAAVMAAEEQNHQNNQVLQTWEREREAAKPRPTSLRKLSTVSPG